MSAWLIFLAPHVEEYYTMLMLNVSVCQDESKRIELMINQDACHIVLTCFSEILN